MTEQRLIRMALLLLAASWQLQLINAFTLLPTSPLIQHAQTPKSSSTALEMGKKRQTRKTKKAERTRPNSFYDAIEEAQGKESSGTTTKKQNKKGRKAKQQAKAAQDPNEVARQQQVDEAQRRMDARPDVSTMLMDEESGTEVLQQGKNVMDVITRKAVQLSNMGADERMKQMFPNVDLDVREKHRLNGATVTVPEMVEKLRAACTVTLADGTVGIPPHTSVAQKAIDFVLANRDLMGLSKMSKTLGRLTLRSFSAGNAEEGRQYQKLWKNYMVLENHISGPFRQIILDAEGKAGPNFGNLDVQSYLGGSLYQRTANYIVLKGMVAHWEKKVVDADKTEKSRQTKENYVTVTSEGDPRRYLPDPPILFTVKECTQVCYMSQQMTKAFVETPELFNDLPPEVRFVEIATSIKGGTPMRKFMKEEFCPQNDITPAELREGVRRLIQQLDNMQVDPYADIVNTLEKLVAAMSVGTDEERNPYAEYLANRNPQGPGRFETYTFNHDERSLVRFFDNSLATLSGDTSNIATPSAPAASEGGLEALFGNFGGASTTGGSSMVKKSDSKYVTPTVRSAGRPHEVGWYDELTEAAAEIYKLDKMPAGKIIREEAGSFDI